MFASFTVLELILCYSRVFCTHAVGYKLEETSGSASEASTYDKITLRSFTIAGGAPNVHGRCFIEVLITQKEI